MFDFFEKKQAGQFIVADVETLRSAFRLWAAEERAALKKKEMSEALISSDEVCKRLAKNKCTLWRWEKNGYLVPVKVGGLNYYRLADIEKIEKGGVK